MAQLTIRWTDPALERHVRRLARQESLSLNHAALRLMRRGAGLDQAPRVQRAVVGSSLDALIGTWTKAEARTFERTQKPFEKIDQEFWR